MEHLEIRNFLTIKKASLDVRYFTVLIGPEATGKSVIAKVLYFFRSLLSGRQFIESIQNHESIRELEKRSLVRFKQIFPAYAWENQEFALALRTDEWELSLSQKAGSRKKPTLRLSFSKELTELHRIASAKYKEVAEAPHSLIDRLGPRLAWQDDFWATSFRDIVREKDLLGSFVPSVFIPAGRSFFAILQKRIFSLLARDVPIDTLIKEFGDYYEGSKSHFTTQSRHSHLLGPGIWQEIEAILGGQYVNEDDQDWIVSGGKRISLSDASSGQQESAPLLIVLWWLGVTSSIQGITFLIEEPEAHLFPPSQRRLIGVFSRSRLFLNRFFLTTHSPYILTAINSLIMASNLIRAKGSAAEATVRGIICPDEPILFEDVSAYTINNGFVTPIMDQESRLIGTTVIDSVSDEFDSVMDRLLEVSLSKVS